MSDAPEEKDWAEEEELLIELDPETGRLEGVGRGLDYGPRVARLFPEAYDYATLLEDEDCGRLGGGVVLAGM